MPLALIDPSGMDACATDNGNGTATITNASDGGEVDCPENGFYIATQNQVNAVGFNANGDLSVYGANGSLFNPDDNSPFSVAQTVNVGEDGKIDESDLPLIDSPGLQFIAGGPDPSNGTPQRVIVPLLPDPLRKTKQTRLNQRCAAAAATSGVLATNAGLNEVGAALSGEVTPFAAIFHGIALVEGIGAGGFAAYAAFACYNAAQF